MSASNPEVLASGLKILNSTPQTEEESIDNQNLRAIDAAAVNVSQGSVSAAGTSLSTATLLLYASNNVTVVASGAGVRLNTTPFIHQTVKNSGANDLLIYPNTTEKDIGEGAGNPMVLPVGSVQSFDLF